MWVQHEGSAQRGDVHSRGAPPHTHLGTRWPPLPLSLPRSPKRFWLPLQMLLGPILPPITSLFGWIGDRAARRHNQAHGMPPRTSS